MTDRDSTGTAADSDTETADSEAGAAVTARVLVSVTEVSPTEPPGTCGHGPDPSKTYMANSK